MFGIRYAKSQPTTYLMQFKRGRVVREGAGLSFFYYAPASSLVAVPVASKDQGFIFEQLTADFQTVTVQGQVAWRVSEPRKLATMLDFTLKADGASYASEDPDKLPQRLVSLIEVLSKQIVKDLGLRDVLRAADQVAAGVLARLRQHAEVEAFGLDVLNVAVHAIKPTPETARALEAEAREAILKSADDAIFLRRVAAVENERAIRESELDTEVAVEAKRRTVRETQMAAEASIQEKQAALRQAGMDADVALEGRRRDFVALNADNTRMLADAEAHRLVAVMRAVESADPRIVQALAAAGMRPDQLIAQAFGGIADRADRIGQLNISPDLLQTLLSQAA
jgi:hypothetical protein